MAERRKKIGKGGFSNKLNGNDNDISRKTEAMENDPDYAKKLSKEIEDLWEKKRARENLQTQKDFISMNIEQINADSE